MKVLSITTSILEQASGSTLAVLRICGAIADRDGVELELLTCTGTAPSDAPFHSRSFGFWKWPPRLGMSPGLRKAINQQARGVDLVHSHGVWNSSCYYAGRATRANRLPHIVTPHGSLCPDAIKVAARLPKALAGMLYQDRVLSEAACLHATSEDECRDFRSLGLTNPVAVIPLGIDIPDLSTVVAKANRPKRRLLFLGRITPKKGVEYLLEAWGAVQDHFPEWELHITGTDDRGYEAEMKALCERLQLRRVIFTGPVYGAEKARAFFDADVFVLPTKSENFGMAVAEALAHGVPAVVTNGAPWQGLETHDCGWWIDVGVEPLEESLKLALAESPELLQKKGQRGGDWMEREFSWQTVGEKMFTTYEWILKGGETPEWVKHG